MRDELRHAHIRGIQPPLSDPEWSLVIAALEELPDVELSAQLASSSEALTIAFLDDDRDVVFLLELTRDLDDEAPGILKLYRKPNGIDTQISTDFEPLAAGTHGPIRNRRWTFELGDGTTITFESLEEPNGLDFNRKRENDKFARAFCRSLGWDIPD